MIIFSPSLFRSTARSTARSNLTALLLMTASTASLAAESLPEEVVITGQREIYMLRDQVRESEAAVYELYNQLNTDDLYDVHCRWEQPTGTRFRYRICRPAFLDVATNTRGQDMMSSLTGTGMSSSNTVEVEYQRHLPMMKQQLEASVAKSPELAARMQEHLELKAQLEERERAFPETGNDSD